MKPIKREHRADVLDRVAIFSLLLYAAAWPWEIYQRMPLLGGTLTRWTGLALIALAGCASIRDKRWIRTGLEWPITLFAAAVAISTFLAEESAAALGHVPTYVMYALMFYSVAALTIRAGTALWALSMFAASSAGVAVVMYLCQAGWIAPAAIGSTRHLGARISDELRAGALMRMSATAPDLNQGIVCVLLAFAIMIAVAARSEAPRARILRGVLAALLFPAILISLSRSAILVAIVLIVFFVPMFAVKHRACWTVVFGAAALLVAAAIYASPYGHALGRRASAGLTTTDASLSTRAYGIKISLSLVPTFWLHGTGLGGSDAAIQAVADPARLQGRTLHSVPLKYLLELGVLGLIAYLWFWVALCRGLWGATRNIQGPDRLIGTAGLAVALSLFAFLAVQPFTELSLFPWLFGVLIGFTSTKNAPSRAVVSHRYRNAVTLVSAAITVLVVVPNVFAYQRTVKDATECVRQIDEGIAHENRGEWVDAVARYEEASRAAESIDTRRSMRPDYRHEAITLADAGFVTQELGLNERVRDLKSMANYGLGRAALAAGEPQRTIAALNEVPLPESNYLLGESHWLLATFDEAISQYSLAFDGGTRQSLRIQAHLNALQEIGDLDARLESASLLAKLGRWNEALAIYRSVSNEDPANAEALYGLGINAEMLGDESTATQFYQRAVTSLPNHRKAAERLAALGE